MHRLIISSALLCAVFMLQTAHAGQAPETAAAPDLRAFDLPNVDREDLIESIETLRSQLIQRMNELVQVVADSKFDSSDALITAILPGGLLYAGYKKARHEQASDELARVRADIEESSSDLLAMQSLSAPVFVAQLP
ncbi:MAG TPA: hypothetical protein VM011_04345 [Gammaproteobacteria bacterium]|nr:hypothetical protein [Gammaproteobacteria bacterium]